MTYPQIILLALIQGMAELLPVSSTAHVIVAEKLMGLDPSKPELTFLLVMLHTGTMFAVLFYFWPRWKPSLRSSASSDTKPGMTVSKFHFVKMIVLATVFVSVPFVVTIHDLIHLHHRNPLGRLYARSMIGRAVRKSRAVFTVSHAVRDEIASLFGHDDKIFVTPNGVDPVFTSAGAKADGRYFLFVGNDKRHKNVDRLVEAVPRDVQLVLAGGSFERFRSRERVVLAGFVPSEQLAALYRGAIALVLPSLEEGFGLPALEAMACGTAVITSNARSLVEVTGDAAIHVDGQSVASIADAMTRVMRDERSRAAMIDRGSQRAREFTWRRCAEITREIYRRIA